MKSVVGTNPTAMYKSLVESLDVEGSLLEPRGKSIKELRPVVVEFLNPFNRFTFLGERKINPFFQVAESLWILSGRSDVKWLTMFNKNMASFSDDGEYFNAPYGERIRTWNKNSYRKFIFNPIDQLSDVYVKLLNDKDTRQAVVSIYNPAFDNSSYTIDQKGLDIACNMIFTVKIRDNKLHLTVFNRSNDIHWGLFGANLCQFTTIQECLLSWLRNSGEEEFANLEIGTYTQITDSLHMYLDDYGSKITNSLKSFLENPQNIDMVNRTYSLEFSSEPRMTMNYVQFETFLRFYWSVINPKIEDDSVLLDTFVSKPNAPEMLIDTILYSGTHNTDNIMIDSYWKSVVYSMGAYRLLKLGHLEDAVRLMRKIPASMMKLSMMYFLKSSVIKEVEEVGMEGASKLLYLYKVSVTDLLTWCKYPEGKVFIKSYLNLGLGEE